MSHNTNFARFSYNPLTLLHEPGVEKLVHEILEAYVPTGKILLVLPCSAKKPYGTSQSQRLYWRVARETVVQEDILERATLSGIYGIVPALYEDRVASYNFNLNRASFTCGKHREIVNLLADRVYNFLDRHGHWFQAIIAYGRERYQEVMQLAAQRLQLANLWVIPRKGVSLRREGLEELRQLLERLTHK